MLDGIQDPGNLGTLIRTAAAFNFKTIVSENTVDYYNEKVIRSSQGALFYTNLIETELIDFIKNSLISLNLKIMRNCSGGQPESGRLLGTN